MSHICLIRQSQHSTLSLSFLDVMDAEASVDGDGDDDAGGDVSTGCSDRRSDEEDEPAAEVAPMPMVAMDGASNGTKEASTVEGWGCGRLGSSRVHRERFVGDGVCEDGMTVTTARIVERARRTGRRTYCCRGLTCFEWIWRRCLTEHCLVSMEAEYNEVVDVEQKTTRRRRMGFTTFNV